MPKLANLWVTGEEIEKIVTAFTSEKKSDFLKSVNSIW